MHGLRNIPSTVWPARAKNRQDILSLKMRVQARRFRQKIKSARKKVRSEALSERRGGKPPGIHTVHAPDLPKARAPCHSPVLRGQQELSSGSTTTPAWPMASARILVPKYEQGASHREQKKSLQAGRYGMRLYSTLPLPAPGVDVGAAYPETSPPAYSYPSLRLPVSPRLSPAKGALVTFCANLGLFSSLCLVAPGVVYLALRANLTREIKAAERRAGEEAVFLPQRVSYAKQRPWLPGPRGRCV